MGTRGIITCGAISVDLDAAIRAGQHARIDPTSIAQRAAAAKIYKAAIAHLHKKEEPAAQPTKENATGTKTRRNVPPQQEG